jgi:hypothetical protein
MVLVFSDQRRNKEILLRRLREEKRREGRRE